MRKFYSIILGVLFPACIIAADLKPIETKVGGLSLSIDPRIELLGVIQTLHGYIPECTTQGTTYDSMARKYFAKYSNHKAVVMTGKLMAEPYGFAYDASPCLMMHHTQPDALKRHLKYNDYIIWRAGGKKNLVAYTKAIRQFARESNFADFWNSNIGFYQTIVDNEVAELGGMDVVKTLEDYYNEKRGNYNIIFSPLSGGCSYGVKVFSSEGTEIYSMTALWQKKDMIPFLPRNILIGLAWHCLRHRILSFRLKINELQERKFRQVTI